MRLRHLDLILRGSLRSHLRMRSAVIASEARQSGAACDGDETVLDCFVASLLAMTRAPSPPPQFSASLPPIPTGETAPCEKSRAAARLPPSSPQLQEF